MGLRVRFASRVLAVGVLAAVSLPGVRAARAESDLVPPAKQLFAYDAKQTPVAERRSGAPSCGANPAVAMQMADAGRAAAMARIAELAGAGGGGEPLNGRGIGYPVHRDPTVEMMRIQQEARRLQTERAAQTP